jgi:CRISPR system Cascade subunit CasA
MTLLHSLLDDPLIRTRSSTGAPAAHTLPGLLAALARDEVRDFPALRPHQRHPWHAFLVQLAALALHRAGVGEPFSDTDPWRAALLALTPDDPDGAAWCLIAPPDRPAFMQPPVPEGRLSGWKGPLRSPDELDMLITSKNHDLKASRMQRAEPDDWLLALISLQTQQGVLGAGNYGVSRMAHGHASRSALGIAPKGGWGRRWRRDVAALLDQRERIVEAMGLRADGGVGLVWLPPWNGENGVAFSALDPFYIEICRRIRLTAENDGVAAMATGSKVPRIEAKERNGVTGDPWTPIDQTAAKALNIGVEGFHYKLAAELLLGGKYLPTIAQQPTPNDGPEGLVVLAQGVTRGEGKTKGYHERRIPISPTVRQALIRRHTDPIAKAASDRIKEIGALRGVLWTGLGALFDRGGAHDKFSDSAKEKATRFAKAFEQGEDSRFFDDLNEEIEAGPQASEMHLQWLLAMARRAELVLENAFVAGPQGGEQRYRARAAALGRFHGGLRKNFPSLAQHFRQQQSEKEIADDHA